MSSYSFLDVTASITGAAGNFPLGSGGGIAEEGITIERMGDDSTFIAGADGGGIHQLSASTASTVTVRLLANSPSHARLMALYQATRLQPSIHGTNIINVDTPQENITLIQVAIKKVPSLTYGKETSTKEWIFEAATTVIVPKF